MYVECFSLNSKPYLRLVKSVRTTNKSGIKTAQKQVVLNIGPLSHFDDGQPNYVERLKNSFKAGDPLIPALKPYCSQESSAETYRFTIKEGSPDCFGHPKLFSHVLLERIIEELGLNTLFSSYKNFTKLEYNVYGFAKLLIFGRILNPTSKSATVRQNEDYYDPILKEGFNPDNVYDTLDFIYDNKEKIIRRMNTNLVKKAHRSPEIIYFDVTNFYFETEEPDEDILDEEGNVIKIGQRKMGVSKENRKQPIVQMGLFMDDEGIPISIETFPGNTLDHLTLRPALKKSIDTLDLSRFILVADRGIFSYVNALRVLDDGNGYIVSKSLQKCPKTEQEWAYSDDDYINLSDDFKYKSRILKRTAKDENGNIRTFDEKIVVYWSRKFQERNECENKKFLDFLTKLEKSPENFRITSTEFGKIRKFMKNECVNKKTGEIIRSSDIRAFLDFDKIAEYRKHMGYYQIVTSELTLDPLDVIEKYHGLSQIEDQFHEMKGALETRPIHVRTDEHVTAHLLTCLIALVALRIIQKRITDSGILKVDKDVHWSYGLSVDRIQTALNKWKVDKMPGELYRFMDVDDPDLQLILQAFNIKIPAKLYRKADLKALKTGIEIFK